MRDGQGNPRLASYPSLLDKHVFVTGGGSGIGQAIVSAFAAQGARVSFVDILDEPSRDLCAALADAGWHKPVFRQCDLTDLAALERAMRELMEECGDVDVLVNNAANDQRRAIGEVSAADWDQSVAVNQRPVFFTCQTALPGLRRRGGAIINVGSTCWRTKGAGYPVYASAKAAILGLTRALARDLGPYGIRVNTVSPGWVMTERQIKLWVDAAAEQEIARNQCLPGKLMPNDVASMVLFLAADDSAMCTAQEFIVDAGWV